MKCLLFNFGLIFYACFAYSQSINPKEIISAMSSKEYYGRGYSHGGDKKAADYIRKQLKKIGIPAFNNTYFQYFSIQVNTFPDEISVHINDSVLIPGKDFIISPNSLSCKGSFDFIRLSKSDLLNGNSNEKKYTDKFVVIDTFGMNDISLKKQYSEIIQKNPFHAKGMIEVFEKLPMFGISQSVNDFPVIQINRKKIVLQSKNHLKINLKNQFFENYKTQNVLGFIKGKIDSFIVFTAHYDHLGEMGKNCYFPGANDNCSGVAMLLNLAEYFSKNKPYYSIAFMFFSAEEAGLLGSYYYTQNPVFPLQQIKFLINFDVIGSGEKGIQIVNSTIFKNEYNLLVQINEKKKYFSKIHTRGKAANSDHYFFFENKVPSFFIYTLGDYKEYHNIFDTPEKLPLTKFKELFNLIVDFVNQYK